jgi:OFA family oxalate/formate antiporter-like MFS transporter
MPHDATPLAETLSPAAERLARVWSRVYYGYWLVGAAFIAQFVSVGSQNYVIGVFLKPMTDDLGWSRSEFTLSRTLGQVVMAFTGFFIGAYVDRRGGRRLMTVGVTVMAAALLASSWVQSLWQWVLLNGLVLTAGAAMVGNLVVNVTLSKWFVEKRGRVVGFAAMGVSFAGVVLPPLMTAVVDAWGWRAAWRVLAVGAAALIYPVSLLMRRAPEDHGLYPDGKTKAEVAAGLGHAAAADYATSLTRREALHTVSFYVIVLAFGLFGLSISVMLLQTIPFMTDAGYSRGVASLMITLTSVPALVTKPVWGYFIDKTDAKRLAALGAALAGASIVTIVTGVQAAQDPVVYLGFFVLGAGWGGLIPLQEVIWASFFGRRYLGAVRSAGLPFSLVLGAGGPLLTSVYYDAVGNYNGAFLAVAALNVIAAALMLTVRRPIRPERPAMPSL